MTENPTVFKFVEYVKQSVTEDETLDESTKEKIIDIVEDMAEQFVSEEVLPEEDVGMELGNLLFGNSRGEYRVPRKPYQEIFWKYFDDVFSYHCIYEKDDEHTTFLGGYENEVFLINPYYWGDDEEIMAQPNFIYKPENITIDWYKYPMRDSYSNVELTPQKADEIFRICRESMR